jgi:hypothetical protein
MRELAVGPSTSSNATHASDRLPNTAPAVESIHFHSEAPSAASKTPGTISRDRHKRLGQTITDSKSRK